MVEISLRVFWHTHFLLIKATISDSSYGLIKDQLIKKIFSDLSASSSNTVPLPGDTIIKTEETH